jgi:hypothetical protein
MQFVTVALGALDVLNATKRADQELADRRLALDERPAP